MDWPAALLVSAPIALVMAGCGLLVGVIAGRAADGRLGPNAVAGIRTSATRHSEVAWAAAHRAGRGLTVASAWVFGASGPVGLVAGAAAAAVVTDGRPDVFFGTFIVVLLVLVAVGVVLTVLGAVRGHRAAQAVIDDTA